MPFLPSLIQNSNECKHYFNLYRQSHEQFDLFNKRIQRKCMFYIAKRTRNILYHSFF